jgi:hypothetical protein
MAVSGDEPSSRTRWLDAVGVLAVVVTVILAARQLRPLVEAGAFVARTGETMSAVPASAWLRAGAWVAIGVAVLFRWRTAAALGAWAGVLFEIIVGAPRVSDDMRYAAPLDLLVWPLVLAITAAVLLSVSAAVSRGPGRLGRRGYWLLAAAAAVTTLTAAAIPLLGDYYEPPPANTIDSAWYVSFAVSSNLARAVAAATFAAVLVLALATISGVDQAVRSRVHTLMAAGTAGFVAIQLGLPRPFNASDWPVLSHPAQVVVFVMAPGLILGAGLLLIRSAERLKLADEANGTLT